MIPLISYLGNYHLVRAVPSKLCQLFDAGEVDCAILPVYNVLTRSSIQIVDEISISCSGPSGSVLLFLNTDVVNVKQVGLDSSSLSSNYLLKIMLKRYYQLDCEFQTFTPDRLVQKTDQFDAYLLIGDKAIEHQQTNKNFLDLGEIWYKWTKLPFVFAVWVSRTIDAQLKADLLKSKRSGLKNLSTIIENVDYPDKEFLTKYYSNYLRFHLGQQEKDGILLYQKMLYEEGLLKSINPLHYF